MAKQRQNHSIVSALSAVTAALRIESLPNPTPEQLQQIHDAKVQAANIVDNSNFKALAENVDEAIEASIVAEEEAEQVEAEAMADIDD